MRLPFDLGALWARALAWYQRYSERDRRIILGVLGLTVASVAYLWVVTPILDYKKGKAQQIADGQEELERAMRFLTAKDTLRAEREDLRKRLTQAKARLLPGGTGTLGAAALQERANAIASERGITLQSTQVMKDEVMDPFRKVSVRVTLSGELKPLAELVAGLEYERQLGIPFIEIARRGAVAGAKGPRNLSVTLEVTGFVQGGAKGDAAAKADGADGEGTPPEPGSDGARADGDPDAAAAAAAPGGDAQPGSTTTTTTTVPATATTTTTTPARAPAGAAPATAPPRAPSAPPAAAPAGGATTTTTTAVPARPAMAPITFPSLVVPTPTLPHDGAAPAGDPMEDPGAPPHAEALPPTPPEDVEEVVEPPMPADEDAAVEEATE